MKDRKEEFVLARDIKVCAVLVFLLIESETGDGGLGEKRTEACCGERCAAREQR